MMSLTEQAIVIVNKYWKYEGGFVFCDKINAKFCVVNDASWKYDDYAFVINFDSIFVRSAVEKMIFKMENYCIINKLEFIEK